MFSGTWIVALHCAGGVQTGTQEYCLTVQGRPLNFKPFKYEEFYMEISSNHMVVFSDVLNMNFGKYISTFYLGDPGVDGRIILRWILRK